VSTVPTRNSASSCFSLLSPAPLPKPFHLFAFSNKIFSRFALYTRTFYLVYCTQLSNIIFFLRIKEKKYHIFPSNKEKKNIKFFQTIHWECRADYSHFSNFYKIILHSLHKMTESLYCLKQ
jgi:hypothetical protein